MRRHVISIAMTALLFIGTYAIAADSTSLVRKCRHAAGFNDKDWIVQDKIATESVAICRAALQENKELYLNGNPEYDTVAAFLGRALFMNGKEDEAVELVRLSSNRLNPIGSLLMGVMYDKGIGVDKKSALSAGYHWEQSARAGNATAQYYLATGLLPMQFEERASWLRKSATQGYGPAEKALGDYLIKVKKESDYHEALKWYRQAVDHGTPEAWAMIGSIYYNGMGLAVDVAKAVEAWQKGAANNDPDSQERLGAFYLLPESDPRKTGYEYAPDLAIPLITKSADNGWLQSMDILATMYDKGQVTPKDTAKAALYFRKLAERGSVSGLYKLAKYYIDGEGGLTKDPVLAYALLKVAHTRADSDEVRQDINKSLSEIQLSEAQAQLANRIQSSWRVNQPIPVQASAWSGGDKDAANDREQAERKKWKQWQTRMQENYDYIVSLNQGPDAQAREWKKFLENHQEQNPFSEDDDHLRSAAQEKLTKATAASQGKSFDVTKDCPDCPEMVAIPAGGYKMGGIDLAAEANEKPVHTVQLQSFLIGRSEVTRGQYAAFIKETGYANDDNCINDTEKRIDRSWRNPGFTQDNGHPVVCVSWNDAQSYARWLSKKTGQAYRLATEAEWEYACRAGGQGKYCGGNNLNDLGWCSRELSTHPVNQKQANAYGLHDMNGNVWEWVEDCYHNNYQGAPIDGSAWTSGSCDKRVLRGASSANESYNCRASSRHRFDPNLRIVLFGFRVVRAAKSY